MNIISTETLSLAPGANTLYTPLSIGGAGTIVPLIFGDLDTGEALEVQILGTSDLVTPPSGVYVLEQVTLPADVSNQSGYQGSPVPVIDTNWRVLVFARVTGAALNRDITLVGIAL